MTTPKAALGADLVIPLLALGFAIYFFWSITDLAWEAKANGVVIGTALIGLVVVQVARIAVAVAQGRGDLRTDSLWQPRDVLRKRLGMVAVTVAFILLLQVLGLTLSLFSAMAAALWIMGVRKPSLIFGIAFGVAAAAYLLFIATLDAGFPHGPIEKLFS
ncbi:MAG TPA: tripartite tricarboxylate transporter TctB family protein [Burkholderiales bacterium]|nr:tripartite tricarboxylate transporter TctB family protein [Burkholderiales bacterium]